MNTLTMRMLGLAAAAVLLWSCQKKTGSSTRFEAGVPLGKPVTSELAEASGLVASAANPGLLWTHNDSGNPASVYLISPEGEIKMTCHLAGITNRDWEDIALGTGPDSSKSYVYVADIGDNMAQYAVKILYRFEEPVLGDAEKEITTFDTLYVKLDDGVRDTEALMIDPIAHGMYMLSKREDSVHFYKIDYPYEGDTLTGRFRVKLPFHNICAADISADGKEVVIKDYDNIYYWTRPDGGPISKLLQTPPEQLAYTRERQGEAIAFARDGSGFYTLSESVPEERARVIFFGRSGIKP